MHLGNLSIIIFHSMLWFMSFWFIKKHNHPTPRDILLFMVATMNRPKSIFAKWSIVWTIFALDKSHCCHALQDVCCLAWRVHVGCTHLAHGSMMFSHPKSQIWNLYCSAWTSLYLSNWFIFSLTEHMRLLAWKHNHASNPLHTSQYHLQKTNRFDFNSLNEGNLNGPS